MAYKLFLLEFHVGHINFDTNYKPIPSKEDIVVDIKFGDVNINIDPEILPLDKADDDSRNILYSMGKSYLFTTDPKDLIEHLKTDHLKISLMVKNKNIGSTIIPWSEDFRDMVKLYEKIGVVKAVDHSCTEELKNKQGQTIGKLTIFLRLSCFGDFIETQYKSKSVGHQKEYVFKNPYDKNTFKCELVLGTRVLPVMNLYNPVTKVDTMLNEEDHHMSWTEIFGVRDMVTEQTSRLSYSPFGGADNGMIPLTEILQHTSLETISICFRPEENKFFDLLNLISTEVSNTQDGTTLTFTKEKPKPRKSADEGTEIRPDDPLELTADKINRKLCKNKDCPAAIKFKEYGIGPLATGKGLGTVYGNMESDVQYGISNTYGTMSNYGPFGIYSRPKHPDQPFIPPTNTFETKAPKANRKCSKCSLRLRGGGPWPNQPTVVIEKNSEEVNGMCLKAKEQKNNEGSCSNDILRLRGGGPDLDQPIANYQPRIPCDRNSQQWCDILRLKGGGPLESDNAGQGLKSPIRECKEVMDKFDEILMAYKRALGPCGQATCPNAPSLVQEKCKSVCGKGQSIPTGKDGGALCETPCDFKDGYTAAACRDPKCAYAKYKLDLVDDDAALELQFLPPAVSGKCGHPMCPYPIQQDLPPIHWDCPDPLPKGKCKNLNCPLQPPDLRKLKCPPPKPGPCGSVECPYALPPPCELPTCPFRPQPCPFMEKQKTKQIGSCYQPESEEEEDDICDNPECPFADQNIGPSESFDTPNVTGHFMGCTNPQCPFTRKKPSRPKPKSESINVCGNPSCPFAKLKKQEVCDNPSCPFAPAPKRTGNSCGDPQCPFVEPSNAKSKLKESDICENPDCPYTGEKTSHNNNNNKNKRSDKSKSEICDNPDCPSNAEKCSKESADCSTKGSVCENPECPFAESQEKSEICNDPLCPYMQPLPSCGIPGCPYEPVPIPCPGLKKQTSTQKPTSPRNLQTAGVVEAENSQGVTENSNGSKKDKKGEDVKGNGDPVEGDNGKKKKRKKRSKFVYTMGNQYPGVKVGHKECVTPIFKVPAKMGWLWNIPMELMMKNIKPRRGWKPGAIQRNIAAMIRAHREAKGLGILKLPKFKRNKDGCLVDEDADDEVSPKPTLQIQKKDGAYWITMNPLKDPKTLVDNENPYMDCTPMQFKITKNKKKKDGTGDTESKLCYCEEEESSSSDSELDIEFTPPAGIIHPERFKKKKNIVHCEVQYDPKDFSTEKPEKVKEKGKKGGEKGGKKGKKGKK